MNIMNPQAADDKTVKVGKYKIKVIRAQCIGAGPCAAVSPDTFKIYAENKAVVEETSTDSPENIIMAAQSCPARAIVIEDAETGEKICPL